MANTYKLIASATVGSGGTSYIEFNSIPATYTDLKLVFSCRTSVAYGSVFYQTDVTLNSGTNSYSDKLLVGYGTTFGVNSGGTTIAYGVSSSDATASAFGSGEIYIPNYAGSRYKTVSTDSVSESNDLGAANSYSAGLFTITSAVNSVRIRPYSYNSVVFVQNSSAYLYGISNS